MTNPLASLWRQGRRTRNGWLSIPSPLVAEIMARAGWDSITVDMQHGMLGFDQLLPVLQAMSATPVVPIVRVPWREPGICMKVLDAGALGIICPMVNNREEAAELVSFCRYPPDGVRSFGPTRAALVHGGTYARTANDTVLVLAMIETAPAVEQLEEIVTTPGLDGVYVGPADLSLSLGFGHGFDHEDEARLAVIRRIVETARAHGRFAGIHCGTPAYARRMWELGFHFISLQTDARLLAAKCAEVLAALDPQGPPAGASSESVY